MDHRKYHVPNQYWASDEPVEPSKDLFVLGTPFTREDVLYLFVRPALESKSANEMFRQLSEARRKMMRLGVFSNVHFVVDQGVAPGKPRVAVEVDEVPRKEYGGGVGGAGVDRAALQASLGVLNMWGRGERWRSTVSYSAPGSPSYFAFEGSLHKPLLWSHPQDPLLRSCDLSFRYVTIDRTAESRLREISIGGEGALRSGGGALRAGYEMRRLTASGASSWANVEQSGWHDRVWLGIEQNNDMRDNPLLPSSGHLARAAALLFASLSPPLAGPRLLHVRVEYAAQSAFPLPFLQDSFAPSLLLRARAGHLVPLNGSPAIGNRPHPSYNSMDAYHMGGADHVPGFYARGMGRSSRGESLGAASFWLLAAYLHARLGPHAPDFLRVQLHAAASGLSGVIGQDPAQQGYLAALAPSALRASVGVSLVAALSGTGRISLGWSKILLHQQHDSLASRLQLGFVTSFD